MKPLSLSKIFNKRIFRIPDYQRGYSWQNRLVGGRPTGQLVDFWTDLVSLDPQKTHYTGLLTLEKVPEKTYKEWNDDLWVIDGKGFDPYYVVDGQQRLTTCMILLQCIIEFVGNNAILNDTSVEEIRKDYIFQKKPNGILRTYIFGYEPNNPSNEFLKTKIFNEFSSTNNEEESLYTTNLEKAKLFFKEQLSTYNKIDELFIKLTQKLVFNEYIIENDLDVFIAFETMNNRGKPLSNLELLKNRLIYLSTIFRKTENAEKEKLRININACWKTIYQYLGKNKKNLMLDDVFLRAHWIMYFTYSRKQGKEYVRFLLEQHFIAKNILDTIPIKISESEDYTEVYDHEELDNEEVEESIEEKNQKSGTELKIEDINNYVASLQKAVKYWYCIFNPLDNSLLSTNEQIWLDKICRIGIGNFGPLILSSFCSETTQEKRIELLMTIEKYIFLIFRVSQRKSNTGDSEFYRAARELYYKEISIDNVIAQLQNRINQYTNLESFKNYIKDKFTNFAKDGFYGWGGLRYFLYEYEVYLMSKAEYSGQKVTWATFIKSYSDCVTIEHIYPQSHNQQCWIEHFSQYDENQRHILCNCLGNLLLLSQPKNSHLQNDCFNEKRKNEQVTKGYFNGSYSETRVANNYNDWTPETIKERSLELLKFMEDRWNLNFGDEDYKLDLLQLSFMRD